MNLRTIIAIAAIYVALYGLPEGVKIPDLPLPTPAPVVPDLPEPSRDMQKAVEDVADICKDMEVFDRLVWMASWQEAANVIDGEEVDVEVSLATTLDLKTFTASVFDVAWKRLARASGKYRGLDAAVEKAFEDVIGNEVVQLDQKKLDDVVEFYEALAWAGGNGE